MLAGDQEMRADAMRALEVCMTGWGAQPAFHTEAQLISPIQGQGLGFRV